MKLINLIPVTGLVAFVISTATWAVPSKDQIFTADWSTKTKPSVVERSFTKKDVAQFLDNWRGVYTDDPELAEPALAPEKVGDFKWIDIDKDGVYELFVTSHEHRYFFGGPLLIYRAIGNEKTVLQAIPGSIPTDNIDEALQDIDGDGMPELIVLRLLTSYRGAATSDFWTDIYQWNGRQFEDASVRFKDFYLKRILPQVIERIRQIAAQAPDLTKLTPDERSSAQADHELALALQWTVHDKLLRFTSQDSRAGIDRAREWTKSQNRELRRLAVDVFADAGLSTYLSDVQLLASDLDIYVSGYAKTRLKAFSRK